MGLIEQIKKASGFITGSRGKEELIATVQEWDELLKACTTRIETLEKGYEFLRRNMFLKMELVAWKRLALVSTAISLVTLVGVVYLLFFRFR